MKLFISGGAGFIGSNFVRFWLKTHPQDELIVYDKLTYAASVDRLPNNESRMKLVKGDICNLDLVNKYMKSCDVVVHFAAETHVDRSLAGLEAERLFFKTNVEGTQTLLYAAKKNAIKRFHHISTDEVFGELDLTTKELFDEDYPYNPHNPYSISKAASDFVVRSFAKARKLPITITNCTNNYGPYQTPEKMIPRSISLLLAGKKIKLYTDDGGIPGKNIRDWLHVDDHCEAIQRVLVDGREGETYCVGGQNEVSNFDLVCVLLAEMSTIMKRKYTYKQHVEHVKDRPGHDTRYAMNIAKIRRDLGWSPKIDFTDGIRQTIKWYLSSKGQFWLSTLEGAVIDVREGQSQSA